MSNLPDGRQVLVRIATIQALFRKKTEPIREDFVKAIICDLEKMKLPLKIISSILFRVIFNKRFMDAKTINKWRQTNKRLFYQFPSEWVAFSPEKGIMAHNPSRKTVAETLLNAGYSRLDFIMEYIHPYEVVRPKRILPIRIKSVTRHEWKIGRAHV